MKTDQNSCVIRGSRVWVRCRSSWKVRSIGRQKTAGSLARQSFCAVSSHLMLADDGV